MKGVDLGREGRELRGGKVKSARCRAYNKVLPGKLTAARPAAKNKTEGPPGREISELLLRRVLLRDTMEGTGEKKRGRHCEGVLRCWRVQMK